MTTRTDIKLENGEYLRCTRAHNGREMWFVGSKQIKKSEGRKLFAEAVKAKK